MTLRTPAEPLSQVVFLHDYLQLVFGDSSLSIYGPAAITIRDATCVFGQTGFCDAMVSLLGATVLSVAADVAGSLHIQFDSGAKIAVAASGDGPESWQLNADGEIIVG